MSRRRITLPAVALVAGLVLAGCSSTGSAASTAENGAEATSVDSTPTVTATPPVVDGAVLTTEPEVLAEGQELYDLFDDSGNWTGCIVFDKAAPLPESIRAAIAAPVNAAYQAAVASGISGDEFRDDNQRVLEQSIKQSAGTAEDSGSSKTDRDVIIVYPTWGSMDGVSYSWLWVVPIREGSALTEDVFIAEREAGAFTISADGPATLVAELQAWAAKQPNPAAFEIIGVG